MIEALEEKEDPIEIIIKCKRDVVEFARYCFTKDEADSRNTLKRFPIERPHIKFSLMMMQREKKLLFPKSRRMQMTWSACVYILWDAMFHPGKFNPVCSKKQEDAEWLLKNRIKFIYDNLDKDFPRSLVPKMKDYQDKLEFEEIGSTIQAFPQGEHQLRQFTASTIFADEMAFWPEAEGTYAAAKPTLDGGGSFIGISSPAPGFFKKMVFDEVNSGNSSDDKSFGPPKKEFPMKGIEVWRNPMNRFTVVQLHYSADPTKNSAAYKSEIKAGMPIARYNQEYELQWDSYDGMPVYPDFVKTFHGVEGEIEAQIGLPLLLGFDFGLCYDDQTEVLTEAGWKLFKDVSEKERVATMNPETFSLEYEIPKLKVDMPYKGKLLNWENSSIVATMTPDHIVPCWTESGKFTRKYAKNMHGKSSHDVLRVTAVWNNGAEASPLRGVSPFVFSGLMGAWLSHGCSEQSKICIYKENNKEFIREILEKTPYRWVEFKEGFRAGSYLLSGYLDQFGKAFDKFVPVEIKNGTKEMITEFIRVYTKCDGHIRIRPNGAEEHTIFSVSKRMIDDLSELALKIGWASAIRKVKPQKSLLKSENRIISSSGGYSITFKKGHDYSHIRGAKHTEIDYDGRVYCLSVSHGLLYVRKNGRPHWNGNTPACVVAQLQGDNLCVLREYVEINMGAKRFAERVAQDLRIRYPAWSNFRKDMLCFIDPAGFKKAESDETTCANELAQYWDVKPGEMTLVKRLSSVEYYLNKTSKGQPCFRISIPNCPVLVRGFLGGYRYPEKNMGDPKPLKDEHSHSADALQMITSRIRLLTKQISAKIPSQQYFRQETNDGRKEKRVYGAIR